MTDAYFGANCEELDTSGDNESGYSLNAGVRTMLRRQFELSGEVGCYYIEDGEATMKVSANYYFINDWAVGASYEMIDDLNIMSLTARYSF